MEVEEIKVALLTAVKNEESYIVEHYLWHKEIGVSKFFYYHNDCTDKTAEVLGFLAKKYDDIQVVENVVKLGKSPQSSAYHHFFRNFREELNGWYVLVIDVDEFLSLKNHANIKELIQSLGCPDAVSINWMIFGSSGYETKQPGMVTRVFTQHALPRFPHNQQFKTLWRMSPAVVSTGVHRPEFTDEELESANWVYANFNGKGQAEKFPLELRTERLSKHQSKHLPRFDQAQINHYVIKSQQEYLQKKIRGRGLQKTVNGEQIKADRHNENFFKEMDKNDVESRAADKVAKVIEPTWASLTREFQANLTKTADEDGADPGEQQVELPATDVLPEKAVPAQPDLAGKYLYFGNLGKKEPQFKVKKFVGLTAAPLHDREIVHNPYDPLPVPDSTVEKIQAQDVLEGLDYNSIPAIFNDIYRALMVGGIFRLSLPDYRSPLLKKRSVYDDNGNVIANVAAGGSVVYDPETKKRMVEFRKGAGTHLWFPDYDRVLSLVMQSDLRKCASITFHHGFITNDEWKVSAFPENEMHVHRCPPADMRAAGKPVSIVVDFIK